MKGKKRQDNEDPKYVLVSTYVTFSPTILGTPEDERERTVKF